MELRVLQYFLTVAREGNITRAADILHITQPTLSRQLQQLEQESVTCADLLGVPLITPSRLYVQKEISNWLGSDINKLQVVAAVNLMTHAAMFINSGIACGLTIEGAVDLFEDDKLAFRPLEPELAFTSVLAWKRFQPVGNAAAKFLEYIKNIRKAE